MVMMEDCRMLADAGMDVEDLLKRLMGNDKLIRIFVERFLADSNYTRLAAAIETDNWLEAESASHTLKGMCGNLSLTALYLLFTEQVRHIRAGETKEAAAMMPEISAVYEKTTVHLRTWLNG